MSRLNRTVPTEALFFYRPARPPSTPVLLHRRSRTPTALSQAANVNGTCHRLLLALPAELNLKRRNRVHNNTTSSTSNLIPIRTFYFHRNARPCADGKNKKIRWVLARGSPGEAWCAIQWRKSPPCKPPACAVILSTVNPCVSFWKADHMRIPVLGRTMSIWIFDSMAFAAQLRPLASGFRASRPKIRKMTGLGCVLQAPFAGPNRNLSRSLPPPSRDWPRASIGYLRSAI